MTIQINHIAIWTKDLELMRDFYTTHFQGTASKKYVNSIKKFASYFIEFQSGARIELMWKPEHSKMQLANSIGLAHLAISLGSKDKVNHFTEVFRRLNLPIVSEPRITGDGYYESVICDPEGNYIELTV